jgi:hypothetical protein
VVALDIVHADLAQPLERRLVLDTLGDRARSAADSVTPPTNSMSIFR